VLLHGDAASMAGPRPEEKQHRRSRHGELDGRVSMVLQIAYNWPYSNST
jgi:hypothetical protein